MSGPIGSNGSGFTPGSRGNIQRPMFEMEGFTFQERFDFASDDPCIDIDIIGVKHRTLQKLLGDDRHIQLDDV